MIHGQYFIPLQDVSDINTVDNKEYLSFDYFDSLQFSTANVNLTSRKNSSLDEIDDLRNNQIESTIHQSKYYDSQTFESISQCNKFSLLFNNIYSFNANFDAYLLSYSSHQVSWSKYLLFVKRCVHQDQSSYTRYMGTNRCSEDKLLIAVV